LARELAGSGVITASPVSGVIVLVVEPVVAAGTLVGAMLVAGNGVGKVVGTAVAALESGADVAAITAVAAVSGVATGVQAANAARAIPIHRLRLNRTLIATSFLAHPRS
jgi:hypothetical protein